MRKGRTLWVTRARPKVDRIACPWLIRRFVDPEAMFLFVPPADVPGVAERFQAAPFDIEGDGVFWSHRGELCTFDVMVAEFGLGEVAALQRLAPIVRGADTARPELAPQAAGLLAVSLGLSRMYADDHCAARCRACSSMTRSIAGAATRWTRPTTGFRTSRARRCGHERAAQWRGTQIRSLILTRSEISALMRPADWLAAAEAAFRAAGEGRADAPPPLAIHGAGGVFHAKAAGLRGARHYVALKLNANFPGNPQGLGLPTIQGAILLCDGETGAVLAIMDSIEITLRRTAAATALAARYLARPDAASVLICGCGAQGAAQLEALRDVRPLARCFAWDRDPERAAAFAATASAAGLRGGGRDRSGEAALASDIIVTCTTARRAISRSRHGARRHVRRRRRRGQPGKKRDRAGADGQAPRSLPTSLEQCVAMGDLHHAIAAGAMTREAVHAELAELVSGAKPGRTSADEIIIFDSTGTGLQDVAAAAMIYERAAGGRHGGSVALAA